MAGDIPASIEKWQRLFAATALNDQGATRMKAASGRRLVRRDASHPGPSRPRASLAGHGDLLPAGRGRPLALAQGRCNRDLALLRRRTAGAEPGGNREVENQDTHSRPGPRRRPTPAARRTAAPLAGGAHARRVDAGGMHGVARIRFCRIRDGAAGLVSRRVSVSRSSGMRSAPC